MPPRARKSKHLVVLNTGRSTINENDANVDSPFLANAKLTLKYMIEKRIFAAPKDEIGLITYGCPTQNRDNMPNVKVFHQGISALHSADWRTVEEVANIKSTNRPSNWLNALNVALTCVKEERGHAKADNITIVLITDFKEEYDEEDEATFDDDLTMIIDQFLEHRVDLFVISENSDVVMNDADTLNSSQQLIKRLLSSLQGPKYATFEALLPGIRFYLSLAGSTPWNVPLRILDWRIRVSVYIRTQRIKKHTSIWKPWKQEENNLKTVKQYVGRDRNTVNEANIIQAYAFGDKYIPMSEENEELMSFDGGPRGMSLYAFAPKDSFLLEHWVGNSSRVVFPEDSYKEVFYSLARAMKNAGRVAIVRRVYNNGNMPQMSILIPQLDAPDEPACFIMVDIPYVEDRRAINTNAVDSILENVTDEQRQAMDNFIDSMTLTDDDENLFEPNTIANPGAQHEMHVIAARALNPECPLPPVEDFVTEALLPSPGVAERSEPFLHQLMKAFPELLQEPVKPELPPPKTEATEESADAPPMDIDKVVLTQTKIETKRDDFDADDIADID